MKHLGALILLMVLFSCTTPRVIYDYDKKTNFTQYKTYNFYPDLKTGLSQLDTKRLLRLTDSILQSRGFVRNATPDFYINIEANAFQPNQNSAVGVGVGGTGRNVGGGISIGLPLGSKLNQQLLFDFVDVQKDELYWQAVAEGFYKEDATPEQREEYFKKILLKVFKDYPPKK